MKTCDYCGRKNDDDAVHCRECGTELGVLELPVAEAVEATPEIAAPEPPSFCATTSRANVVATLCPDEAPSLIQFLLSEKIPAVIRKQTEASGLEVTEVVVEESNYDAACDAAERWQAVLIEERERKSGRRCPSCNSWHLNHKMDDKIGIIFKCRDCQLEFTSR